LPAAENLATVKSFFERVLNAGDTSSLAGFSNHDVVAPPAAPGIESFKRSLVEMRSTFSSPEYRLMDAICEGEKVAARFSARATHSGKFMGIPATGRTLKIWGMMIFKFEGGSISEFWRLIDSQDILLQLRSP
jgi:predicted ester cyclase